MLFMKVEMFGTQKSAMQLSFSNFDFFFRFTRPIRQVREPTPFVQFLARSITFSVVDADWLNALRGFLMN